MSIKLGICQWNLPVKGIEGCKVLKSLGLDGMEADFTEELEQNIDEYAHCIAVEGIEIPTLGMNVFCGKSYVEAGSEDFFEQTVARALECAGKIGAGTLQFPAFFASEIKDEATLVMAADNLKRACDMAASKNVVIGTENALGRSDNEKLFELVDRDNFRFYFDNQNLMRMKGMPCAEVFSAMRDRLIEVHVKDSLMVRGKQQWMPLGQGDCEFESSVELLKNSDYNGWIHLENDYQIKRGGLFARYDYAEAIRLDAETVKDRMNIN